MHEAIDPLVDIAKDCTCEEDNWQVRVDRLFADEYLTGRWKRVAVDSVVAPSEEHSPAEQGQIEEDEHEGDDTVLPPHQLRDFDCDN